MDAKQCRICFFSFRFRPLPDILVDSGGKLAREGITGGVAAYFEDKELRLPADSCLRENGWRPSLSEAKSQYKSSYDVTQNRSSVRWPPSRRKALSEGHGHFKRINLSHSTEEDRLRAMNISAAHAGYTLEVVAGPQMPRWRGGPR